VSKRNINLGRLGEAQAAEYLRKKGYKILARNFRTRWGEIDLVALNGSFLVLIEVKTRWSKNYGLPEEAVTPAKIYSIKKVGQYFKTLFPQTPDLMRIDVIAIELDNLGNVQKLRHLKNVTH